MITSGTRLGSHGIVFAIGAGGMGEVWRARDTRLERDVAIKVLPAEVVQDPERLGRFKREAHLLAARCHLEEIHRRRMTLSSRGAPSSSGDEGSAIPADPSGPVPWKALGMTQAKRDDTGTVMSGQT